MKFTISPNSLWASYRPTEVGLRRMRALLPDDLQLAKVKLLRDDDAEYKLLFNVYHVNSLPWLLGTRIDIQTCVRSRTTGLPHLLLLDVFSDTLLWDPTRGVCLPNLRSMRTRQRKGRFRTHLRNSRDRFFVDASLSASKDPDYDFIVSSNRVCFFANSSVPVPATFDEEVVMQPVRLLESATVQNTLWSKERVRRHDHLFIHEHPMEFDLHPPLWYAA